MFADTSLPEIATSVTAVGGLAAAIWAGFRASRSESKTADVADRTVDLEYFRAIQEEQRKLNESTRAELAEARVRIGDLRITVAECEADKGLMASKIDRLEAQVAELKGHG